MPSILNRLQSGWNAFLGRDPTRQYRDTDLGFGSSMRPDKSRYYKLNDRTIIQSVICRIGIDAASIAMKHVRLENDRYTETINSKLNNALTLDANLDQTGRAFMQDAVMSMCDEGVVAIVPTDTTTNPFDGGFDVLKLRTAKVIEWYPKHVKLDLYNENSGKREQIVLPKAMVAIVENPLYAVMNEPNSTLQRLKRILANLDVFNERNASDKLNMIIQLPYVIKSQSRKEMAETRRKEIEMQLVGSKYGIAYTDGTEKIMQLNRPLENNYWTQAKDLTSMLYNQLGLAASVFDGTADERTMNNYFSRTIEPILSAIAEEMERKFLTKNARTRGEAIRFFRDPFKLVTLETLAMVANTLTTQEIASANEIRTVMGWKPSDDPRADQLKNANIDTLGNGGFDPSMMGEEEIPPEEEAEEYPEEGAEEEASSEDVSVEEIDELLEELNGEIEELKKLRKEKENQNG